MGGPAHAGDKNPGDPSEFGRRPSGPAQDVVGTAPIPDGPVDLAVDADGTEYRFTAAATDGTTASLGSVATKYLSTEVAGSFTGVYVGCYATGNGETDAPSARFESFAYRSGE